MENKKLFLNEFQSPIGKLYILSIEKGLVAISFTEDECEFHMKRYFKDFDLSTNNQINKKTISKLNRYFNKKLRIFDIPIILFGTEFQKKVWIQLLKIPFGKVISYKELAYKVKIKKGFQAVGQANGKNPIPIIIPCHRVITSDNKLGGYGGGLDKKIFLLELEGVTL
jgi:methylated-DNA-[protein]-cysteine S-methyltransferase